MTVITAASSFAAGPGQHLKTYTVNISGEGLDFYPDSSLMLVFSENADYRFDKPTASGYIVDGRFTMSFRDSITRIYRMAVLEDIRSGSFMTYSFFSDGVPLHFRFSQKYGSPRAEVTGSPDNEELYLYRNRHDVTYEAIDSLYMEIDTWIISKYGEEGYPEEGTEDYAKIERAYGHVDSVYRRITRESKYDIWEDDRIRNHKSLAGLYQTYSKLGMEIQMIEGMTGKNTVDPELLGLYHDCRTIYPDSWMVKQMDKTLADLENLRPGMPYPDFTAPSIDGNRYSLSELVDGKIAVIDFWASWCGPCRRHSIELVPVYEKYKDRGFTVVGVAREYGDLKDMEHAIKSDGYPWIQLYDLDGTEGLWDLYGLSTAGGGVFLIGTDGTIVEKVSEINSIVKYLEEHLGK